MKTVAKINSSLCCSIIASLLLLPANATGFTSEQPIVTGMSVATTTFPVPVNGALVPTNGSRVLKNGQGSPFQLFDIGQASASPMVFDAVFTPTNGSAAIFQFLSDGGDDNYYQLTIDPTQQTVSICLVQSDVAQPWPNATQITSVAHAFNGGVVPYNPNLPIHFQLQENQGTFTVYDVTGASPVQVLSVSDTTISQNPAVYVGSNVSGNWNLRAAPGTAPNVTFPNLGSCALVCLGLGGDDRGPAHPFGGVPTGAAYQLGSHFGLFTNNMTVNVNLVPMNPPSVAPGPLGHVTIHRQDGPGPCTYDYGVFVYQNNIQIAKDFGNGPVIQQTNLPGTITLTKGTPFPLQIVVQDGNTQSGPVTISVYSGGTLIQQFSDSTAPYTSGFQFGVYTDFGAAICWNNLRMTEP